MIGTIHFKDGHCEDIVFVDINNNPRESYVIFETDKGRYGQQTGVKVVDFDEANRVWNEMPFIHFHRFDFAMGEWVRTEEIDHVVFRRCREEV